jgi:hypothetical protein
MGKKSSKASFIPVLVAVLAFIASVAIYFYTRTIAHALMLHIVGYLLTPLAVALCMGLDSIFQRRSSGKEANFEKNKQFSLILRVLTGLSFLAAFPHIFAIAKDLAEKLAGQ